MNFLAGVNRILRINGIIRGDDDALTSFAQTQHASTSALAQISIQDQLGSLTAEDCLPYQATDSTLTLVSGQRLYNLDSTFVRFRDPMDLLHMLEVDAGGVSEGTVIPAVSEAMLRRSVPGYREQSDGTMSFYIADGPSKSVGFYPVPGASDNGQRLRYYFEKDIQVEIATDELPFVTATQAYAFCRLAARHFQILFQQSGKPNGNDPSVFESDPVLITMRAQLFHIMNTTPAGSYY